MTGPEISVIVPVWNAGKLVDQALASIGEQRVDGVEIILVDDGSTDGFAGRPQCRCLSQPNRGPAAARNHGLREARGSLIAFLDADDLWTPGHLRRLTAALREHPEAGIAQGRMQQFAVRDDGSEYRSGPYRMPYLGTCLFRASVFRDCGVFDESMRFGEDYDFLFRCWEQNVGKLHVEEVSLLYRRHAGNMTGADHAGAHMTVLKRRLDRLRSGQTSAARVPGVVFQQYIGEVSEAAQWRRWSA